MCIKIIKNSFLLACASLAISGAYGMEVPEERKSLPFFPSSRDWESNWDIHVLCLNPVEPEFTKYTRTYNTLLIRTRNKLSYIQSIIVSNLGNEKCIYSDYYGAKVIVNPHLDSPDHKAIVEALIENNILFYNKEKVSYLEVNGEKSKLEKFFCFFYDRCLIPDEPIKDIAERIKSTALVKTDRDSVFQRINAKMGENSTADDFKEIAHDTLLSISDPVERAQLTWELILDLRGEATEASKNFDRLLIIDLCEKITDKTLPFFNKAKLLSAELALTDDTLALALKDRYKKPMIFLATTTTTSEGQKLFETFAKQYISNDILSNDFAEELKGLTFSPESMFNLLDIIRKQNIELKELRGKK